MKCYQDWLTEILKNCRDYYDPEIRFGVSVVDSSQSVSQHCLVVYTSKTISSSSNTITKTTTVRMDTN